VKGCAEIDRDHRVPVVVAQAHRQVVPVDPCIVDHDVEAAEGLHGLDRRAPRRLWDRRGRRRAPIAVALCPDCSSAHDGFGAFRVAPSNPTATEAPARARAIAVALPDATPTAGEPARACPRARVPRSPGDPRTIEVGGRFRGVHRDGTGVRGDAPGKSAEHAPGADFHQRVRGRAPRAGVRTRSTRTGEVSCARSRSRRWSAVCTSRPSTLHTTGGFGSESVVLSSIVSNCCAAAVINGE